MGNELPSDDGVIKQLHALIRSRVAELADKVELPTMAEIKDGDDPFWFPVPGFYGGFSITVTSDTELDVSSWCRVVGGSGQRHKVTPDAFELLEEGFV